VLVAADSFALSIDHYWHLQNRPIRQSEKIFYLKNYKITLNLLQLESIKKLCKQQTAFTIESALITDVSIAFKIILHRAAIIPNTFSITRRALDSLDGKKVFFEVNRIFTGNWKRANPSLNYDQEMASTSTHSTGKPRHRPGNTESALDHRQLAPLGECVEHLVSIPLQNWMNHKVPHRIPAHNCQRPHTSD
jgi:hypothetical protein